MVELLGSLLDESTIQVKPQTVGLQLPKLKKVEKQETPKLKLPKLKKVN